MARTADERQTPYYPAFLDLRRKRVVVVGGGSVASGKVRGLLPCGPEPLIVVAPRAERTVQVAAAAGRLTWHARPYQEDDLDGAALAFAATADRALNARVAGAARHRGVPVLAVDDPAHCDFIAPALVQRGDLMIAISTGGRSPALARWARQRLDQLVPRHWGDLLAVVAAARERLGTQRAQIPPERWQEAVDEGVEALVAAGAPQEALAWLLSHLGAEARP